ncbi:glycoside hydrolase/deacetylase, partial [Rozella allomycis CSF55]
MFMYLIKANHNVKRELDELKTHYEMLQIELQQTQSLKVIESNHVNVTRIPRLYKKERIHNRQKNYQTQQDSIKVFSSCTKNGVIAITIDDGPGVSTSRILDVFKKYNSKATFFFVGVNFEKYGNIIKPAFDEGHLIASHTWSHIDFSESTDDKIKEEIGKNNNGFRNLIRAVPRYIRPPYGTFTHNAGRILKEMGFEAAVRWDYDTRDWDTNQSSNVVSSFQRIFDSKPENSSFLVLMHDMEHSAHALSLIVPKLVEKGYKLVRVDECLGIPESRAY